MGKVKKILKWVIITLSVLIIIVNVTLITKSELNKNEVPDFLGFTPFIIVSGSMEPNIPVDNIIITKKTDEDNIKVGDIISYKDETNNIVVTHRVVNIYIKDGKYYYETKGDSNTSKDKNLVPYSNVQGKYLFKLPIIGKVINFVKTSEGLKLTLIFIICIYILYDVAMREHIRNKKKHYVRYRAFEK